jgi:hypothetical protein
MKQVTVFLFSIFAALPCCFASVPSHEETIVRNTYAQLSYATKLGTIHKAVHEEKQLTKAALDSRLAAEDISFVLSDFSSGTTESIAQRKYSSLVSKPLGDILAIAPGTYKATEGLTETVESNAFVKWTKGQDLSEDWDITMADALVKIGQPFTRYAAFTVRVDFKGKSRTYNALFLFRQGTGGEEILPIDTVTGNSALHYFASNTVYPATLLETQLRENRIITEWLQSNQVNTASCKPGKRAVCCDPVTLKCGPAAEDVRSALSKPISKRERRLRKSDPMQTNNRQNGRLVFAAFAPAARSSSMSLNCEDYDHDTPLHIESASGYDYHLAGSHDWAAETWGHCAYTGETGTCDATSTAFADASLLDSGLVSSTCHVPSYSVANGIATGTSPTANSVTAGAVESCFLCGCFFSVSLSPISFPSSSFFRRSLSYSNNCASHEGGSPILIDTTGNGFVLTSIDNGVVFDIGGRGQRQVSWTDANSGNAFLALDRNQNGVIDSGKELFGDNTAQPQSDDPNGFLALAEFDKVANGGNGDGIINSSDSVWSRLLLWIDSNHNGVSEPNELSSVADSGISSISLAYKDKRRVDEFGNLFRYKGDISGTIHRTIYDVVFMLAPQ